MIRGGKKLYGSDDEDEEPTPDLTVQASAIGFRDKVSIGESPPTAPKSITYTAISRYLDSLKQPDPPSKSRLLCKGIPPQRTRPLTRSADKAPKQKTVPYNTVTININPDTLPATKSTLTRVNTKGKYNYHLEDHYPEQEDGEEVPQSKLDIEFIDLDYYGRSHTKSPQPEVHHNNPLYVKRVSAQSKKPPSPIISTPTKKPAPKITSSLRAKAPSAHLTITPPTVKPKDTLPPPTSPLDDASVNRPITPSQLLARSRPATPNTLLKRVSARSPTPGVLASRPPSSNSSRPPSSSSIRPTRPSTASSISSKSTTKRKSSKAPPPQPNTLELPTVSEEPAVSDIAKNAKKYLNTEYFSDDDEYRNVPTDTESLTTTQLAILTRAFLTDLHLFQLCFFDDYSRIIVNKRLSLATKEASPTLEKMVNAEVINFLGQNGLSEKVRTILNCVQKRQDAKITEGNILQPEEADTVFSKIPPEIYPYVEETVWKILRRELKIFLSSAFETFLGSTMQAFLDYVSGRVLKGKVKRFTSEHLADHFTRHEIANLHLAINDPAFICESEERVWWNDEDGRVGWYDSDSTNWMRRIDKFFLNGVLSTTCFVCKGNRLKYFDAIKCPTCTAHGSALEFYNRYYCKEQCLHTHMNTTHSVYIAAPSQRNEMCEVCKATHELYICKKCHSVLDFHGQHRLVILHERNCTGPK